eukprot:3411685-Alexandrium_andersonii.AAC.1
MGAWEGFPVTGPPSPRAWLKDCGSSAHVFVPNPPTPPSPAAVGALTEGADPLARTPKPNE